MGLCFSNVVNGVGADGPENPRKIGKTLKPNADKFIQKGKDAADNIVENIIDDIKNRVDDFIEDAIDGVAPGLGSEIKQVVLEKVDDVLERVADVAEKVADSAIEVVAEKVTEVTADAIEKIESTVNSADIAGKSEEECSTEPTEQTD